MIERHADIPTPDGTMRTFLCHPERDGPHPAIIFLMDAPGIRDELRDMVRRLASVGYYVMLPNLYHRAGVEEIFEGPKPATTERMFALMEETTIARVMVDVDTLLAFADIDPAAADGPVGIVGYCMSGRHAIAAAARHPDRIAAAASVYGTRLVTEAPDSPHRVVARATAELYFGCAAHDDYVPPAMVAGMRQALAACDADAEVEIFEGVGHGFAFPKRSTYDRAAAERHWERLFALFGRRLGATRNASTA